MIIDDLKDKIAESSRALWNRIEESSSYNQFKEKYDALPPQGQKAFLAGVAGLVSVILFFMIPYSFYSTASDEVARFEYNRALTRSLFRVEREVAQISMPLSSTNSASLDSQLNGLNTTQKLTDEQRKGVQDFQITEANQKKLIPKRIVTTARSVRFSELNIQQITEIATQIERIDEQIKIWSVSMTPNSKNPLYFDVEFKVALFSLPVRELEAPKSKGTRSKRRFEEET